MTRGAKLLVFSAIATACFSSPQAAASDSATPETQATGATPETQATGMNELTAAEQAAGWRSLFDGKSLTGWRAYRSQSPPAGWAVRDGLLTKSAPTDDIISADQFGDFELAFEWRLSRAGNAGVFYRATEEYEKVYWSGPEYQLLDDANHGDGRNRLTAAGAAYGLYPAPAGVVKGAGDWNSSRIVVKGGHVEHWLNGTRLLEYELGGAEWQAKVKASKFDRWPGYGRAARGHIAIQGDHEGELALRNIRIREV